MTLEQLLTEICAKHDLNAISVHYSTKADAIGPDYGWYCNAHFGVSQCESASAGNPAEAINRTLAVVHEKRVCEPNVPSEISLELAA